MDLLLASSILQCACQHDQGHVAYVILCCDCDIRYDGYIIYIYYIIYILYIYTYTHAVMIYMSIYVYICLYMSTYMCNYRDMYPLVN